MKKKTGYAKVGRKKKINTLKPIPKEMENRIKKMFEEGKFGVI